MNYLQQAKETYERDGIAIIPGVFSKQEVNKMRGTILLSLHSTNPDYPHEYLERRGDFPALLFWPALVHPYLNEVRSDERLSAIVTYFLGPDTKQLNNQVYFRLPGDGDQFAWHQDICFREPADRYPGIDGAYLQTIIAIDDITLENAPVEFIAGSHKTGVHDLNSLDGVTKMLRKFERRGLQGQKYLAKAGDVLVWSVLTVHGSEENESDRGRMTYMNGFARADAALDWPYYTKDGIVVPINPRLIP